MAETNKLAPLLLLQVRMEEIKIPGVGVAPTPTASELVLLGSTAGGVGGGLSRAQKVSQVTPNNLININ